MRYTFGDALPLAGGAAPLLTAAIAESWPRSIGALGRRAGISKFAASRAAAVLRERQLLLVDQEEYSFNDEHPLAPTLTALAWDFSGVRRVRPSAPTDYPSPFFEGPGDGYEFRDLIPPSLSPAAVAESGRLPLAAGPCMLDSRRQFSHLGEVLRALYTFEATAQGVYSYWHNERLRDVIHQTLHFGPPTQAARRTLEIACSEDQQADQDPTSATIPGAVWARATYLLSAETRRVLFVTRIMSTAIDETAPVHRLREDALQRLSMSNKGDGQMREQWISEALAFEAEAREIWSAGALRDTHRYAFVGGTPTVRDVGTAGDQILAIELHAVATTLASEVRRMAEHPCMDSWAVAHPDERTMYELATEVPADLLSRHPR